MAAAPLRAAVPVRGTFPIDLVIRDASAPRAEWSEDRAVVDAILGGDREAFRALVDREAATVVRACYRILADPHEAEDAAQEAFVIAFRSLASWRGEGSFGAWLSRIAVRVALRQLGKRRSVAWAQPTAEQDPHVDPRGDDPASLAVRGEASAELRAAVARLDQPYRETVALRFFADRSLVEIAAETGRPLGTVKTHLHRGLLKLRDVLAEPGSDR